MATLNLVPRSNYAIAVITLSFVHLIFYTVTATTIVNGGFSTHLIRKNSPKSPFREHKNYKVSRRLIGPNDPEAPIRIDPGDFEHIMKLSVGTPPFDVYLIADTGSDLLWTQCEPCKICYKTKFGTFDPRNSSTFKNITCRSRECSLLGESVPRDSANKCKAKPTGNCIYTYSYADESYTQGPMGTETISLNTTKGEAVALKNILIGCGVENKEIGPTGNSMGLIGLGRGPLSFVSQIAPYVGGKKFSHCFVSDDSDSKIYFGNGSEVSGEGVVTVPLEDHETFYYVTVTGMSINNDFVPFNSSGTTVKKGNMLIDSGTPFGRLPQEIFDHVAEQLQKAIPLKSFVKKENGMTSICFNSTTPLKAPAIAVNFEGGGKVPLKDDVLFVKENEKEDAYCFTYYGTDEKKGMIGGIHQIDLHLGFDLDTNVVHLKPTNCGDFNRAAN